MAIPTSSSLHSMMWLKMLLVVPSHHLERCSFNTTFSPTDNFLPISHSWLGNQYALVSLLLLLVNCTIWHPNPYSCITKRLKWILLVIHSSKLPICNKRCWQFLSQKVQLSLQSAHFLSNKKAMTKEKMITGYFLSHYTLTNIFLLCK